MYFLKFTKGSSEFTMIGKDAILTLQYFNYKGAFTGSYKNMRYHVIKVEKGMENGEKEAKLLVTVWPGPFAYDHTEEEKKERKEFTFDEEGKSAAIDWLNEQYNKKFDY